VDPTLCAGNVEGTKVGAAIRRRVRKARALVLRTAAEPVPGPARRHRLLDAAGRHLRKIDGTVRRAVRRGRLPSPCADILVTLITEGRSRLVALRVP
jgi:hypothetical protein